MSATLMPGATPAKAITASASPRRSRASSVEKLSPMIGATSRFAAGNSDLPAGSARQAARMVTIAKNAVRSERSRGTCLDFARHERSLFIAPLLDILDFNLLAGDPLGQS